MRLFVAFTLLSISAFAHADNSEITTIRKEYQLIQQKLPTFKTETVELEGYSLEGADAKAYRDKAGHVRLIKAELFHESGKELKHLYYHNGMLIFALYITHRYNQHTGITPEIAKQEGIEAFDLKKTLITEDRYYFSKNRMIRWIGENKKEVEMNTKEFKDSEAMVISDSNDMLSKFQKNLTSRSRPTR